VGASGAIAGIMGAYLVLFLHSRVLVLIYLVVFVEAVEVPAIFLIGLWFAIQVIGGVVYASHAFTGEMAFWGHAAGLVTGAATVWLFVRPERLQVAWWNE
jgi:membrane associated rhomboid family serine protease